MLILGVGLVAGALGYMRLARLLASGVLGSGALALTLYASVRCWSAWRRSPSAYGPCGSSRWSSTIGTSWSAAPTTVLVLVGDLGWLDPHAELCRPFPAGVAPRGQPCWPLGSNGARSSISLGDILEFILTVWVAYLLSAFIRFVLQEDVYPHLRLTRGMSYAISSLLNYVIIALGFVLGLGALGLDLTKVTVLAGAFGVGIGFGLQSVVNNFVSGLILLFERPVHVGDIVEVGRPARARSAGSASAPARCAPSRGPRSSCPTPSSSRSDVTNWTLQRSAAADRPARGRELWRRARDR